MTEATIGQHPEGLSPNQELLADLMFDTRTEAPVMRRLQSGVFEKIIRPTSPIDFALEGEFGMKIHDSQPDAPLSPLYINLRELPENILNQFGLVLSEMDLGDDARPDVSSGIPNAGTAWGLAYSQHSEIPNEEVFVKEETATTRKIVAKVGVDGTGRKLRIVDDLASHGQSKLEAIQAAEKVGFVVTDVSVLVDRQQGAREELESQGYKLRAAFTINQLLRYGLRTNRITTAQYEEVDSYIKSS